VLRAVTILLVLAAAACSRETQSTATPAAGTDTAAAGQTAGKPLPEKLPDVLARVNGETITLKEVNDFITNLEGRAGGPVPAEQRAQVVRGVIDQMVGYKLLLQEAKARNVNVSDAEVEAKIDEVRKQFPSEDLFMQTLISRNLTLDRMRSDARGEIAISRLIEKEIADKIAVKPEQVEDFYSQNPEQFKQPERVRASHILIKFPENADASARTQARTKAQQILKDVKAGKEFAALAKQHSQDPGSAVNGGDLGFFQQGQMVGPFNDAAFSLKPGAISDLVESEYGYHIIKVAEKQPGRTVPLDEVRDKVEQFLQHQNRESQTDAFVKALRAKGKVEILV
jgi:peptidyl-prolyl cis-trans isomerase C